MHKVRISSNACWMHPRLSALSRMMSLIFCAICVLRMSRTDAAVNAVATMMCIWRSSKLHTIERHMLRMKKTITTMTWTYICKDDDLTITIATGKGLMQPRRNGRGRCMQSRRYTCSTGKRMHMQPWKYTCEPPKTDGLMQPRRCIHVFFPI